MREVSKIMSFVDAAKNENLDKFIFKIQMNCVTGNKIYYYYLFVSQNIKLLRSR